MKERLFDKLKNKRIAVVGDLALDLAYFLSGSSGVSVETGLQVRNVSRFSADAGAAGNLAVNLSRLGALCDLYGFIGNDFWAEKLVSILEEEGVCTNHVHSLASGSTFVYHKTYNQNYYEESRFDIGSDNIYTEEDIGKLLEDFNANLSTYDAVIINGQFSNSVHTPFFREKLSGILENVKIPVWCDSRDGFRYPNSSIKVNEEEASRLVGNSSPLENLRTLFDGLVYTNGLQGSVVITLGPEGAYGFDGRIVVEELGVNDVVRTDSVGAGDAFLSMLVCAQVCGCTFREMIQFANISAAVSVRTLYGCGHPLPAEIEELASDTDYRYNSVLAYDSRQAHYLEGTEIEVLNNCIGKVPFPKVAIFDHDGTISTMRQGWENVMSEVMVEAIAGDHIDDLSLDCLKRIQQSVGELIDKTTGIQTIMQMVQLTSLIREFGYVPEKEIRTPAEYKAEYAKRLISMLEVKYRRFNEGRFSKDDFTIKDSLKFLQYLRRGGTTVFLASGSDYDDVKFEMDTLGYSHLYNGGIFGSVGDVSRDPKKVVMERIIREIDVMGSEVVVFGDGPVEIREGHKHGFLTIGVASDEKQRFGVNNAKRERLVLAGADILIPDYSWMRDVASYLGWE